MKPSATSVCAASSSSAGSGSSVRSSPITSSLTQSVPSASRARWAVVTASRAVKQPAVFGSTWQPASSSTSTIEPRAPGSTRRSATVARSAPEATTAAAMASGLWIRRCRSRDVSRTSGARSRGPQAEPPGRRGAPPRAGPRSAAPRPSARETPPLHGHRHPAGVPLGASRVYRGLHRGAVGKLIGDAVERLERHRASPLRGPGCEAVRRARPNRRAAPRRRVVTPRAGGGDRGQQHAVAVVAGGPHRAAGLAQPRAELSGVPGRSPALADTSSSSPTSGYASHAASSSRWTPSAVTAVSKPCSSTVAPSSVCPSARANEPAPGRPNDPLRRSGRGPAGAESRDLALHGTHRRTPAINSGLHAPARHHHGPGGHPPRCACHAPDPLRRGLATGHPSPAASEAKAHCSHHRPRVTAWPSCGARIPPAIRGGGPNQAAIVLGRQPLGVEPERALVVVQASHLVPRRRARRPPPARRSRGSRR